MPSFFEKQSVLVAQFYQPRAQQKPYPTLMHGGADLA